jgi:hypothetical protein
MGPGRDQHAEPHEPAPERTRPPLLWRTSVVLVFALAGALFWTARDTSGGQGDIRQDRQSQLPDLIRTQDGRNKVLTSQISGTRADLDALTISHWSDCSVLVL